MVSRPREFLLYVGLLLTIGACGLVVGNLLIGNLP